jgi:hypothetical protein
VSAGASWDREETKRKDPISLERLSAQVNLFPRFALAAMDILPRAFSTNAIMSSNGIKGGAALTHFQRLCRASISTRRFRCKVPHAKAFFSSA